MSKKSVFYVFIIMFVLISAFFLAGVYKSSIEMKNRGENILPSVNGVEDIKQPQIEFKYELTTDETCLSNTPETPYLCSGDPDSYCCNAEAFCTSLNGIYNDGVCYESQAELNEDVCLNRDGYWTGSDCLDKNTDAYCVAADLGDKYVDGHGCMTSTTNEYCAAINNNSDFIYVSQTSQCMNRKTNGYCAAVNGGNNDYIYVSNNDSCMNQKTDAYCSATEQGDKYVSGHGCMTSTTDAYCSATNQGDKYVSGHGCMTSTTDAYCSAIGQGDKYVSGHGCMTSTTNEYCAAINNNNSDFIYVSQTNQCMNRKTNGYCAAVNGGNSDFIYVSVNDSCMNQKSSDYCLVTQGTHYSNGCRSNADECVALEGAGSVYRGEANEMYSSGKCDSPSDQCGREGKVLVGGVCKTYQEQCEQVKKGTWKNGTCITNNNGGNGVSGKTSNKDEKAKDDKVIGTDATLSDIVLSSGRLMFKAGVIDYRVEVSSNVESISIEPVPTDPDATFVITGDYKLKPGDNPFTIVVTAEDGKTTLTYNVVIVRTDRILSSNSSASLIEIANHEINFAKDQTEYEVNLTIDEDELDIKVTAEDNLSITEVLGNEGLQNGDIVTVKVTAEDGSYTVYAIKVNKEEPFNIKDYIPYIVAGVAGLLLIIAGAAVLRGRKSNDSEDEDIEEDNKKDKMKSNDKDDFKMKSKD